MISLKIQVESDTLVLRGPVEESNGCVLRGCLLVHVKELSKVRSITMRLQGRMKAFWVERVGSGPAQHQRTYRKEMTVYEHDWTFLAPDKKPHTLQPDTYRYPFELVMGGHLPETVDLSSCGSLFYKLKATCERRAFSPNVIARQPLYVIRGDQPFRSNYPIHIVNTWANRLNYDVSTTKSVYAPGETITVQFKVRPKVADLRVRHLSGFLKEYATFCIEDETHTANSKVVRFFRDERFPSVGPIWEKQVTMVVPRLQGSVQCHTKNEYFVVHHKLKFTMSFINALGQISDLRLSLPIYIEYSDGNELPTYENAWRSPLYSPTALPTPPLLSGSPSQSDSAMEVDPSTPHTSLNMRPDSIDCADDYFSYQPSSSFGRLPSYRTAIRGALPMTELDCSVLPAYCA